MMKIRIKKQQNKDIDLKPLNVFDYLKSLSQEAKDLMDEIKDADNDTDIYKLVFIGSNKEKFNFFRMPLDFFLVIYNGEIKLKEAEISQINLEKKTEELKYNYKPKNVEENEEINGILMQANDIFEYRDKITETFRSYFFV